jgi:hypothetical protein
VCDWVSQSVTAELKRPQLSLEKILFLWDKKIGRVGEQRKTSVLLLSFKNTSSIVITWGFKSVLATVRKTKNSQRKREIDRTTTGGCCFFPPCFPHSCTLSVRGIDTRQKELVHKT